MIQIKAVVEISSMMSTISDMHRVGQEFLRENNVPINPTHGIRSHEEVYSDSIMRCLYFLLKQKK